MTISFISLTHSCIEIKGKEHYEMHVHFFGIHVRGLVYGFMWITWGVDNNSMEGRNKTFLHLSVVIHVSQKKQETLRKCLIVNNNSKSHTRKKKKNIHFHFQSSLILALCMRCSCYGNVETLSWCFSFSQFCSGSRNGNTEKKRSRAAAICSRNGDFHIFISTEEKKSSHHFRVMAE